MNLLNKESLELNVYDYFNYCKDIRKIRGLGVITSKQFVFYSQILPNDFKTHDDIIVTLENAIHPYDQREGFSASRVNNLYIASVGKEFIIYMPDNGQLSYSQSKFLLDALDMVKKFNQENDKIKIDLFDNHENESIFDTYDVDKVKEKIKNRITKNVIIEEEKIIGSALSNEEIKNNLFYHLDFSKCMNVSDILYLLDKCFLYSRDSYYKDIFMEIFPDYEKVLSLKLVLNNFGNEKVSNVRFDNVKNVLYEVIRNIFKNKNLNSLGSYLFIINGIKKDVLDELFPDFNLVYNYFKELNRPLINSEITLDNILDYEDFKIRITSLVLQKKQNDLLEKKKMLKVKEDRLEQVNRAVKIDDNKEFLNSQIDKRDIILKDIFSCEIEQSRISHFIEREKNEKEYNSKVLEKISSNFIKRIVFFKRIKLYKDKITTSLNKITSLERKENDLKKRIIDFNNDKNLIEEEFEEFTGLDFFPSKDFMETAFYNKNYFSLCNSLEDSIASLERDIKILEEELEEIRRFSGMKNNKSEISKIQNKMKEEAKFIEEFEDEEVVTKSSLKI